MAPRVMPGVSPAAILVLGCVGLLEYCSSKQKARGNSRLKAEDRPSSAVAMLRRVERLKEGGKTGGQAEGNKESFRSIAVFLNGKHLTWTFTDFGPIRLLVELKGDVYT